MLLLSAKRNKPIEARAQNNRREGDREERSRASDRNQMARVASSYAALVAQRRGFSAAITVVEVSEKKVEETAVKLGTVAKDAAVAMATTTEDKTAFWEPDRETGDYRPVTGTKEVDPADLGTALLKHSMLQQ